MDEEEIYELLDASRENAEYRRKVALRCLNLLSNEMIKARGVYSGSMVPNITSVAHLLTMPFSDVLQAVKDFPALDPRRAYPAVN